MNIKKEMLIYLIVFLLIYLYAQHVNYPHRHNYLVIFWMFFIGIKIVEKIDEIKK